MYERLVAHGGKGVSVRLLGGNRAGEMRITRFLHNPKVTPSQMVGCASSRSTEKAAPTFASLVFRRRARMIATTVATRETT